MMPKMSAPEGGTEAPWTALAAEDEWPCYLPTITATAFTTVSPTVAFTLFSTLILELARAPKPSAIPPRLR